MNGETRRTLHEGSNYRLTAVLRQQQSLRIELFSIRKGFISQAFMGEYRFEDFPSLLRNSFRTLENILSFISDPSHCKINLKDGIIGLRTMLKLKNGEVMQLSSGELILQEIPYQVNQYVQQIVKIIQDPQQLPSIEVRNVLKLLTQAICTLTGELRDFKESSNLGQDRCVHSTSSQDKQRTSRLQKSDLIQAVSEEKREEWERETAIMKRQVNEEVRKQLFQNTQVTSQQDGNRQDINKKLDSIFRNVQRNSEKIKEVQEKIKEMEESCEKTVEKLKICSEKVLKENYSAQKKSPLNIMISSPREQKYFKKNKFYGEYSGTSLQRSEGKPLEEAEEKEEESDGQKEEQDSKQSEHIDMSGAFIHQFKVSHNVATYMGQDWTKTQLLGKVSVSEQNEFKIKIKKTKRRYIWLGVVDSTYKDRRWSWGYPNWVYYCGWNGKVYEGPDQGIKVEGNGFKERETVTIHVEQEQGKIYWKVNQVIRACHISQKLKNTAVTWVPLIKFFDTGDMVEWIEN